MAQVLVLVVDEGWQGKGIGSALLSLAEAWAKEQGAVGMYLVSGNDRVSAHLYLRAPRLRVHRARVPSTSLIVWSLRLFAKAAGVADSRGWPRFLLSRPLPRVGMRCLTGRPNSPGGRRRSPRSSRLQFLLDH
ncbi:MAG: GNAT family N-acetyltransferase [Chloroflexota bacterium]